MARAGTQTGAAAMSDENLKETIAEQNRRKLEEHLARIKQHGGVPPKEEPKPQQQQGPSAAQDAAERERQQFRRDWEAWKRVFGGRVIDLTARPKADSSADYELLGVPPTASKEEIRRAFYKLAKENHPDKGGSVEKFREYMSAYSRLTQET